jgi:hypothetical protein
VMALHLPVTSACADEGTTVLCTPGALSCGKDLDTGTVFDGTEALLRCVTVDATPAFTAFEVEANCAVIPGNVCTGGVCVPSGG